jgi:transketolase
VQKGAYILQDTDGPPQAIIISTGSEIEIALKAAELLKNEGTSARVVSMPSWEIFESQSAEYQEEVLPRKIKTRVSIEASSKLGWERYVTSDGTTIGISRFGASAPADIIYEKLGLTPERVADEIKNLLR